MNPINPNTTKVEQSFFPLSLKPSSPTSFPLAYSDNVWDIVREQTALFSIAGQIGQYTQHDINEMIGQYIAGIVESLGLGCIYMGVATASTTPETGAKGFYFALTAGTYSHFLYAGGSAITIDQGEIAAIVRSGNAWTKQHIMTRPYIDPVSKHWIVDGQDSGIVAEGVDGKSAYQIWLDAGNQGTEQDFLNSLKATVGAFKPVDYDGNAPSAIGGTATTVGGVTASAATKNIIVLMPNAASDPTATRMYVTNEVASTPPSSGTPVEPSDSIPVVTYQFVYISDLGIDLRFASGQSLNETYIDDTHLVKAIYNSNSSTILPKADDVQLLYQKLKDVNLEMSPIYGTDVVEDKYVKSDGTETSQSGWKYASFDLTGYSTVMWMSFYRSQATGATPGYCFLDINGIVVSGGTIPRNPNGTAWVLRPVEIPVPENAVTLKVNVSSPSLYLTSNFYCYGINQTNKVLTSDLLVNDLTTGGSGNILTAEQGKVLNNQVSAMQEVVEETDNYLRTYTEITNVPYTTWGINLDGTWDKSSGHNHKYMSVNAEEEYYLQVGNNTNINYAFVKTLDKTGNGPDLVDGTTISNAPKNNTTKITIPEGCNYLIWSYFSAAPTVAKLFKYSYLIDRKVDSLEGLAGKDCTILRANDLSSDMLLTDYPRSNNFGDKFSFTCLVTNFVGIKFCKGFEVYRAKWFEIDNTDVVLKKYEGGTTTVETVAHGLTISRIFNINVNILSDGKAYFKMQTVGGVYEHIFNGWGYAVNGTLRVKNNGSTLTNCSLSAANTQFKCPVWIFGASYEGVNNSRWIGQMKNMGYFNYLLNGYAGRNGATTIADLKVALKYGCPKYLYYAGNNDLTESTYEENLNTVIDICREMNITIIASYRADSPNRNLAFQRGIVDGLGIRKINMEQAVHDPEKTWAEGVNTWYEGFLSSDELHPSEAGATAIAMQACVDFPEIMQYAKDNATSETPDYEGGDE